MAFPFVFESNWESGAIEWDSETDTADQLDVAHYSELARFPWPTAAPWSGAYCLRAQLTGGTADAFLTEGDLNIAADTVNYLSFNIWFSPDFSATANDTFNILELIATATVEVTFGGRITAADDQIELGIGELAPTSFGADIKKGVWYTVELAVDIDDGAGDDGTIDIYVHADGSPSTDDVYATQVGSLDQGAITSGVLGIQDHLATTTGTILIDNFKQDDARLYPPTDRFPDEILLTKSGHALVGDGCIENVSLLSGAATDCIVGIYDTDKANTNDASNLRLELKNTANNEVVDPAGTPVSVKRGAFVQLSGTNPRAIVKIGTGRRSVGTIRALGIGAR